MNIFTNAQFMGAFLLMVVCVAAGYIMRRKNLITKEGKKALTALIYKLAVPCLAFSSFLKDYSAEDMRTGLSALAATFAFYIAWIFIGRTIFAKSGKQKAEAAGFLSAIGQMTLFTLPLLRSSGSEKAVIYCGIMTIAFRFMVYGVSCAVLTGHKKLREAALNPIMLSMLAGLLVWIFQDYIPFMRLDRTVPAIYSVLDALSDLVCPLSMVLIGTNIGESELFTTFTDKTAWLSALIKSVLCPLSVLLIAKLLFEDAAVLALTMAFAAPSSVTVSTFCTAAGHNEEFSGHVVVLSTILCLVSIPLLGILL